jgi:hypothetical protein
MPYRVITTKGFVEFRDHDKAVAYHAEHGIGEIEEFKIQTPAWDKEAYCAEVWRAHSEWYRSIFTRKPDFDYESKGEIAMYLSHKNEELRNQAKALTELWFNSVDLLYAHYDEVTETTADVEAFIQSLPNYEP